MEPPLVQSSRIGKIRFSNSFCLQSLKQLPTVFAAGEPCYRLTICNGSGGVVYHRQSARSPPKLKYQTCSPVKKQLRSHLEVDAAISCRLLLCHRNAQQPQQPQHPGMIFDGIPCERAEDEAFWTTMVTACLISSEKVGGSVPVGTQFRDVYSRV